MLGLALGDLTVTFRHGERSDTSERAQGTVARCGRGCGEDTLRSAEQRYHELSAADEASAKRNDRPAALWDPTERPSAERRDNEDLIHDRTKPFMGRGSLCVTSLPWSCKVTLRTLLVSLLLLLSSMATAVSPTPIMEAPPSADHLPDLRNTEFVVEENIDGSMKSTWTSTYDNVTLDAHGEDNALDILLRSERSPEVSAKLKKEKGCSRQSLKVRVRDLDLGFDSEEWITFFYCSGSCQQHRSNYDVTLSALLKKKRITHGAHGRVSNRPCCRPGAYENVAFMDVTHNWQIVPKLSAANCSCVR